MIILTSVIVTVLCDILILSISYLRYVYIDLLQQLYCMVIHIIMTIITFYLRKKLIIEINDSGIIEKSVGANP